MTPRDLFGMQEPMLAAPVVEKIQQQPVVTEASIMKSTVATRKRFLKKTEKSGMDLLFEDLYQILQAPIYSPLLDLLRSPLCPNIIVPKAYVSDVSGVDVVEVDSSEMEGADVSIPYDAWGQPWVEDQNGLCWSEEGLLVLQVKLFWRSLEELALNNNELEKWSVLKWIFRPTVWKHYQWDKTTGSSRCFPSHERDDPFSFHNCCIAARVDADGVREGVRRNTPADIIKAVEKVCTFD